MSGTRTGSLPAKYFKGLSWKTPLFSYDRDLVPVTEGTTLSRRNGQGRWVTYLLE